MPTTYAIPNGRTVFDATLYTGTTAYPQAITNAALFKPDFVWAKSRSNAQYNGLFDSVRSGYALYSNTTDAQDNTEQITFNSNGFSTPNKSADFINTNGYTYVAWQWQAGQGTTSSNTNGSITSTVSVNASAGFSIVTYTGNGTASTVGHGLGVAPSMIIVKNRTNGVRNWVCYHSSLTSASYYLILNLTNAQSLDTGIWNATAPTSSVFSIGNAAENNESGGSMVAYCWAQVAGFSKFGSYTGNGSTDGPFVYTGFRPSFVMIKKSNSTGNWITFDDKRLGYNGTSASKELYPNLALSEGTSNGPDKLSNGFKLRDNYSDVNTNGDTYIYAAFAANPFKYANAF